MSQSPSLVISITLALIPAAMWHKLSQCCCSRSIGGQWEGEAQLQAAGRWLSYLLCWGHADWDRKGKPSGMRGCCLGLWITLFVSPSAAFDTEMGENTTFTVLGPHLIQVNYGSTRLSRKPSIYLFWGILGDQVSTQNRSLLYLSLKSTLFSN